VAIISKGPKLSVLYASDIHGSEKVFRKFLNAGKFYGVDALIFGGDLTGKSVIPFVEHKPGIFTANIFGSVQVVNSGSEVENLEQFVRDRGSYPHRTTPEQMTSLESNPSEVMKLFREIMLSVAEKWVTLADERLRKDKIPCIMMPGNDDEPEVKEILGQGDWIIDGEGEVVNLRGFQVASFGWATTTPWHSPREITEEEMAVRLDEITSSLDPNIPTIFNLHDPPSESGIDLAYKMTADLKVEMAGGQALLQSVGSTAVRKLIERVQPVLSLHGHIHESRGSTKIGTTLAINSGSSYTEGVLQGAIVAMQGNKVTGFQLVAG